MRRLQIKFPSQIRISGWDFGSSARAMNQAGGKDSLMTYESVPTQADLRTVRKSTTERKTMSTKTSIKRIALVAVAALGLGGISVNSASAANIGAGLVTSINLTKVTSTPTVGSAVVVNFGAATASTSVTANDTATFTGALTAYPAGGYVGVTAGNKPVDGSGTKTSITGITKTSTATGPSLVDVGADATTTVGGNTITSSATAGIGRFEFTPLKAGTYTLTVWHDAGTVNGSIDATEARQTIEITVVAAATLSAPLSSAYMTEPSANGSSASTTTNAVPRSAAKAANTGIAQIKVTLINTDAGADARANTVTATVTGVGFVSVDTTANTPGTPATRTASDSSTASVRYVHINSDGTAGTGSVKVTATDAVSGETITLGTWSYTSYGAVSALSVSSSIYSIGKSGGAATGYNGATRSASNIAAFVVKAVDANGAVANAGSAPTIVPADTLVVASGGCTLDDGSSATYSPGVGVGYYNCNFTTAASAKSGDKATLTIRIVDPADSTKYLTTTYAVTVGGSVAKETITLDKTEYLPGETIVVTQTAKDSSGNPVYDGAASPAITGNKAFGGTLPAASTYVGGVKVTKANNIFAPAVEGSFTLTETSGNAAGDTVSVSAKVVAEGSSASDAVDAANEATDAANAATDAANAAAEAADAATAAAQDAQAAVAALATSVSSLIAGIKAQITTLTNLVIKIQKKVKA